MKKLLDALMSIERNGICGYIGVQEGKAKIPEVLAHFSPEQLAKLRECCRGSKRDS